MTVRTQLSRLSAQLRASKVLAMLLVGMSWVSCTTNATSSSKNVSAASILETIRKQEPVLLENVTIDGDLDFTTLATYPETESRRKVTIESPVFFKNCVFTGKVLAFSQRNDQTTLGDFRKNLTFLSCKFNREVNFQSITVSGFACFSKSQFNRLASFEGAQFGAEAYFDNTFFTQESRFQGAYFGKMANFWKSVWAGATYFQGAVLNGDTQFNLAEFRGNLDFSLCTTYGLLNFNYAQFTGRSIFDNCRFKNAVDFNNTTLKEASFKEAFFDTKASFVTVKSEAISFENAFFFSQKPILNFSDPRPATVNVTGARTATANTVPIE
ncbi:pentapeptide repeat-containing protein [Spirosoma validum]|uniref:Pentapeptide repeat-containing protein n=1 Tax=Spirosoma validum TaxID=2771355 RepID=A0A927B0U5_9BACT|nr:pentapeptide repeat-containing protein [Spirosoma validum]MBD2753486.1 pentapeptide repeat-containing protein [Spirosoma validum]